MKMDVSQGWKQKLQENCEHTNLQLDKKIVLNEGWAATTALKYPSATYTSQPLFVQNKSRYL